MLKVQGLLFAVLLLCSAVAGQLSTASTAAPRIAVVGAGVGGACSAHFLRELLGPDAAIHVFDKGPVGGRTQTLTYDGLVLEAGASIVFEQNLYFRDLADALGLERVDPSLSSSDDLFSIFDGQHMVFQQSAWAPITLARMLWRYGLNYWRFKAGPQGMLKRFLTIYDYQANGTAFETPEQLLRSTGLYRPTQQTMAALLQEVLGSSGPALRFGSELAAAVNRVNYNQGNALNALAGMVSMLPTVDSRVFAIKGGNRRLPEELLKNASALVHARAVQTVAKSGMGYTLKLAEKEPGVNQAALDTFDAIILATPLELSNLSIEGIALPHLPPRKYQSTITTFVRGVLDPAYFGEAHPIKGSVFVSEAAATPFSVIAPKKSYDDGSTLYKFFSESELSPLVLSKIFTNFTVVASHPWFAYPKFHPPEQFAPFKLADGLFYGNAWENAASAMEVACIGGRNSALLVLQHLQKARGFLIFQGGTRHHAAASRPAHDSRHPTQYPQQPPQQPGQYPNVYKPDGSAPASYPPVGKGDQPSPV
ncbi:hypothetical protein WJX72_004119 [[Myrmecia] bisecta]|uniref:Prenylcysteine lyase domain-containing protein n=1 Tax=[Myrmecia] bisecta TaxID=41462 RepID=A0AAW1QQ88_9CHLO